MDKGVCCKYKKRHRKDLTYEEITHILAAAKEPHKLQKDVAQQFHIPANLVGRLLKEAETKPEKLEQCQADEVLVARKKQGVEDVATVMLATTRPIMGIEQVQTRSRSSTASR